MNDALTLQNVVNGLAKVKGTKDIMASISYFFDLYDDDGDGRVDREGILRMSEALLFLSRRGLEWPSEPVTSPTEDTHFGSREARDEQFLGSISSFIRRCFEYADPDSASNQDKLAAETNLIDIASPGPDAFSIGDDDNEEEDLVSIDPKDPRGRSSTGGTSKAPTIASTAATSIDPQHGNTETSPERKRSHAANAALDPAHPLYITLPTFRMVVLADEALEAFFESAFANSFRLSDAPTVSYLTTFSSPTRANSVAVPQLPALAQQIARFFVETTS